MRTFRSVWNGEPKQHVFTVRPDDKPYTIEAFTVNPAAHGKGVTHLSTITAPPCNATVRFFQPDGSEWTEGSALGDGEYRVELTFDGGGKPLEAGKHCHVGYTILAQRD